MNGVAEAVVEAITPATNLNAVIVLVDGHAVAVPVGSTVIAAIAHAHDNALTAVLTRRSVSGLPRGPVCGMGICQECRVTIDGRAHQLSCQTLCEPGMDVRTAAWEARK